MNCIECGGILLGRRKKYCSAVCAKAKAREAHLLKRYGITIEQWWKIWHFQEGLCGVCGKPEKPGTRFVVDHSHQERYVRGLVHSYCNLRVISRHADHVLIMVGRYAESPPAVKALGMRVQCPKQPRKKRQLRRRKR